MKKIAVFHMLPSGGGIRVLRQFVRGLSSTFEMHIHQPEFASDIKSLDSEKITVYPYPMWRKPAGFLKPVAPIFLILRLLSFKKVCSLAADRINKTADAVLIHNTMPVAAPPLLQYLDIPSAYFCYEYPRHIYEKDVIQRTTSMVSRQALLPLEFLEKSIDRDSTLKANKVLSLSTYMQGRIKSIYGRDSRIIRPGVDTSFFSVDKVQKSGNYVLSVGALWPFKGHQTAIRAISLLPVKYRPKLVIVADREYPGYRTKLISKANSLAVEMEIIQSISDEELRNCYRDARAVLCCQHREPYGLVPLEAMACGTPVIALDEGGFVDNVVHNSNGFLFGGSPETASEYLLELLLNPLRAKTISEAGISFIGEHRTLSHGIIRLSEELEIL